MQKFATQQLISNVANNDYPVNLIDSNVSGSGKNPSDLTDLFAFRSLNRLTSDLSVEEKSFALPEYCSCLDILGGDVF